MDLLANVLIGTISYWRHYRDCRYRTPI